MNTMNIPLYIIDAFAEQAYSGNPAAVCLLEHPVDEGYMQKTAAEMNLSETAFLWPEEEDIACDGLHLKLRSSCVGMGL